MDKSEKIKLGISIGDINGIGIEIILKTRHHNHSSMYIIVKSL